MPATKFRERLPSPECFERVPARTRVHENNPVRCAQAEMEAKVPRRDLGENRVVAREQIVRVAAKPPDRRVHQRYMPIAWYPEST